MPQLVVQLPCWLEGNRHFHNVKHLICFRCPSCQCSGIVFFSFLSCLGSLGSLPDVDVCKSLNLYWQVQCCFLPMQLKPVFPSLTVRSHGSSLLYDEEECTLLGFRVKLKCPRLLMRDIHCKVC